MRSRPAAEIEAEARARAESGVAEVVLVGQDLTAYGRDTGTDLPSLLRRLLRIRGDFVYRLLYLYPSGLSRALTDLVLSERRIASYFDIPFQHSSSKILSLMRRPYDSGKLLRLIDRIRRADADAALRATVMVGFPGEGKAEFADLKDFVARAAFDHLGVFTFSPEEGTAAFGLRGRVAPTEAARREREIMTLQRGISAQRLSRFAGRVLDVWVDERSGSSRDVWICRNRFFAPEIDGAIWARSRRPLAPGMKARVRITATDDYDLYGEVV
jgi:ribosomal protein S12 methylthiotransferase